MNERQTEQQRQCGGIAINKMFFCGQSPGRKWPVVLCSSMQIEEQVKWKCFPPGSKARGKTLP